MKGLAKYNAAKRALAESHRIDEIKDIHDKAAAMQVYAKQAMNRELLGQAVELKLRAQIKMGQLLRDMEKHKGGRPKKNP